MSLELPSQESPSSSILAVPVSQHFKNAQHFLIGDNSNFSTVHGKQHNYYNTGTELKKRIFIVGTEEEEAEYAEFPEINRGEVVAIRNISRSEDYFYDREWKRVKWHKYGRMVFVGDVRFGSMASRCTVLQYSGEGAGELWKEDFQRLCGARCPENVQLVAINLSSVPMLILIGDLVPMAHLMDRVGKIGRVYLMALALQMGCFGDYSLWMDTSRGIFCHGPKGPWCYINRKLGLWDLPSDIELVKEDILVQYLGSSNYNHKVVDVLSLDSEFRLSQLKVNRPTVTSALTDIVLAVESGVWREDGRSCLCGREELANGVMRFSLEHNGLHLELELDWMKSVRDWLAQAPSIFNAHGIPLEGDMDVYKLVIPYKVTGTLSEAKQRRREESSPIYLFIPPFSTSTFWSFDPDGQNPITTKFCHHLGLPISLSFKCWEFSWSVATYKPLQAYQVARGFDPKTTKLAQHNGYRIYEITDQPLPSRSEEIEDWEESKDSEESEDREESKEPEGSMDSEESEGFGVLNITSLSLFLFEY